MELEEGFGSASGEAGAGGVGAQVPGRQNVPSLFCSFLPFSLWWFGSATMAG